MNGDTSGSNAINNAANNNSRPNLNDFVEVIQEAPYNSSKNTVYKV
jgi:hypothetical protein